jgi:hypothetical protein
MAGRGMRIATLGWKDESHTPETWRSDIVEGLRALGHRVTYTIPFNQATRERAEEVARDADLVLWFKDDGFDGDYGFLRSLKERGTPSMGVHLDLFHDVPRRDLTIGQSAWWHCEYVLTADGGQRNWGDINHVWLPPAFGERFLGMADPDLDEYPERVVFVGTPSERIHGEHRSALIDWAAAEFGDDFKHWGSRGAHKVWGWDLNRLYASAELVIGDSAEAPYYWSDRVPRTLGRGGILAHPDVPGMREMGFNEDNMILYPRGEYDAIAEQFNALTDAKKRRMRKAAVDTVRKQHTWKVRFKTTFEELGLA